jgi:hypothetical protein
MTKIFSIFIIALILSSCKSTVNPIDDNILENHRTIINNFEVTTVSDYFSDTEFTFIQKETYPFERNFEGELIKATKFNVRREVNSKFEQLNVQRKRDVLIETIKSLKLSNIGFNCGKEKEHGCFITGVEFHYQDKIYSMNWKSDENNMEMFINAPNKVKE